MAERREFIKIAGISGINLLSSDLKNWRNWGKLPQGDTPGNGLNMERTFQSDPAQSVIGLYGPWAASFNQNRLPLLSFRREEFNDLENWRAKAKQRLLDRLSLPFLDRPPKAEILKKYEYDGLMIEEIRWALSYGRPTEALVLKPKNHSGRLPAVLAFHDHGGNKYFGTRKITKTRETQHPLMIAHQKEYYEARAWANELAKMGFVVMVSDAFPFASRRVMLQDVPASMRGGLSDESPEMPENIKKYNDWASEHESIMAKSLFCAGLTWPGVFFEEDRIALDLLCQREDVDPDRIGCGGLSGGGMRSVFMGGLDPRIRCCVTVGFMTTWDDFLLNKSIHHTWMVYVPLLPNELDFPEILGLRVPLPSLILNDLEDDLYTLPGMQRAEKMLSDIYRKAGHEEKFRCNYYPGPHKFDLKMQQDAFDWFNKWLKA